MKIVYICLIIIFFPVYALLWIFRFLFGLARELLYLLYHFIRRLINRLYEIIKQLGKFIFNGDTKNNSETLNEITGLNNRSAECYMNSIIQLLASNDTFIKQLDNLKYDLKNSYPKLDSLIDLLNSVNDPNSKINENSKKLESLIRKVGWQKVAQQDSYDLLSAILNAIYKDIKNHKNSNKNSMPLIMEMMHTFSGINIPSKSQFHLGLSIGLSGEYKKYPGVTLNYLIYQHFAPTIIDDDPKKSSNILFLGQPPNLLLLHIQANKWSSEKEEMIKPEYHIQYEEDLLFGAKCYNNENSKIEVVNVHYKLTAIIHHIGNISGGHYVTYRKRKNNWYLTNDDQVSFFDFKCNICPYILLYEKS